MDDAAYYGATQLTIGQCLARGDQYNPVEPNAGILARDLNRPVRLLNLAKRPSGLGIPIFNWTGNNFCNALDGRNQRIESHLFYQEPDWEKVSAV